MEHSPDNMINEIDKVVGGTPLSQDEIQTFKTALSDFIATYENDLPEMEKNIEEISKLLTVNADNFEELKNQNWFKRGWQTVTGKNKKLRETSLQNLQIVHKGSLMFLQQLASQNSVLMKSVHFAMSRVEELAAQNLKIKDYMIRFDDKFSSKIEGIQSRLDSHDKDISSIKGDKSKNLIQIVFGIALLLISGILLFSADKSNTTVLSSVVIGVLGLAAVLFGIIGRSKKQPIEIAKPDISLNNELQLRNRKVLAEVRENLSKFLYMTTLDDGLIYVPFNPFYKSFIRFVEAAKTDDYWERLDKVFQVEADLEDSVINGIAYFAHEYTQRANRMSSLIIEAYLSESIGLELRCEIDERREKKLFDDVVSALSLYLEQIRDLARLKESLLSRYHEYRSYSDEDIAVSLMKGFLIVPVLMDILNYKKTNAFVKDYHNDLTSYSTLWRTIYRTIDQSLLPLMKKYAELFANECATHSEPLFLEFDARNVELSELNKELVAEIEEMERKE